MPYNIEETYNGNSDEWDDEEDDLVDDGDDGDDEEEPTIHCPYCRAEIWEEAPQCPECGEYLSLEDRQARHEWRPRWIILTAILLLMLIALGTIAIW